jgi:UDP-N-acetylglucosamine 2-epimerase (non-hydrolysing)
MKIVTVLGTRPEIIRLYKIIVKLDNLVNHILIHTGQNFHHSLSGSFFKEFDLRDPDYHFCVQSNTFGDQLGKILHKCEEVFLKESPDKLLILGDTNSSLCAIVAKRMNIPVFHMEAGNRCYDDRVPEEINRRLIDHSSDILMPYTERSRYNLIKEGIHPSKIFVTGNPIYEVLEYFKDEIYKSTIHKKLNIRSGSYFLVTLHRSENVDVKIRLSKVFRAISVLAKMYKIPVVISAHPRMKSKIEKFEIDVSDSNMIFSEPFGFFDFISLEKNACCVLSDSGTVQEECAILGVSNVTLRDVTERPETIECGSNIVCGVDEDSIIRCVKATIEMKSEWIPPLEYKVSGVSDTVVRILHGYIRGENCL